MTGAQLLSDAFERIREGVDDVVDGLSPDDLAFRPDDEANSIAWLIWHLTRVQDDHVAAASGGEQTWTEDGWSDRFALPLEVADTGYGHDPDQVGLVTATAELLRGYHDAVCQATRRFLTGVTDADCERVVDERWDPPVTMGVRLVSVIADDLQHVGQAAYLRGLIERR
ncbi:MAG: DUF664 domain-containing protein [Acidimicrobiales bacterium]|jgi:hypothetical protein